MPEAPLRGKVAIVTGAGRGIGRSHALFLARHGARVIVNDFGATMDGSANEHSAAHEVVEAIRSAGGEAVADLSDVGDWSTGERLVAQAVETFGQLDIVVNNAGILRPKTIVGMSEDDLTSVLRVHVVGSFATSHFAACYWRDRFKSSGAGGGRVINTTSSAGLYGSGQANYAAAKAAIAALTIVSADELARYGVTVNAVSPIALTRMSLGIAPDDFDADHVAEFICWLASDAAVNVTGRVFNVGGGHISIVDRWHSAASINKSGHWTMDELDKALPGLLSGAAPNPDASGYFPSEPRPAQVPTIELPRGDNHNSRGVRA